MASSQDIEARLCAYVDGRLAPELVAEIERHLNAHPQHRRMIQDLIRVRKMVTGLPLVSAPADLGEGLQGQLERSMLLGDEESERRKKWRGRINQLPQIAALAVVLLLAVGLSGVVYYLLRASAIPPQTADLVGTAPPQTATPAIQPAPVMAIAAPATQPVIVAEVTDVPATQPVAEADLDMDDVGDMNVGLAAPPATQPSDTTVTDTIPAAPVPATAPPASSGPPAVAAQEQPATQPVADNGGDK